MYAILDQVPVMFWAAGPDHRKTWLNKAYLAFTGKTLGQLVSSGWADCIEREDLDICYRTYLDAFSMREIYETEYRLKRHDGTFRWVKEWGCPQFTNGEFTGYLGSCIDIHETYLHQSILKNNQELLQKSYEDSPIGMLKLDLQGRIQLANRSFCRMLGYSSAEIIGKTPQDFTHPDDLTRYDDGRQTLEKDSVLEDEKRYLKKDGSIVYALLRVTMIRDWLGTPVAWFSQVVDITSKVKLEKEMDRQRLLATNATKMAALGEMAAGMAHEINNPLTIIMGKAQQIEKSLLSGSFDKNDLLEHCGKIQQTVNRIATIIRGLRAFARDDRQDPLTMATVYDVVRETLVLCHEKFRNAGVEFENVAISPLVRVECRPAQISQVLLNLLNNAFDAIQNMPRKWIRLEAFEDNEAVVFRVSDSGHGIDGSLVEKIFNPFFTTKPAGKGTGLGLSISRGLAESQGGEIRLVSTSSPTTFEFRLPHQRSAQAEVIA